MIFFRSFSGACTYIAVPWKLEVSGLGFIVLDPNKFEIEVFLVILMDSTNSEENPGRRNFK